MVRIICLILLLFLIDMRDKYGSEIKRIETHYINVKKGLDINFPKPFIESLDKEYPLNSDKILNVNYIDQTFGDTIKDSIIINQIHKIMSLLTNTAKLVILEKKIEVHFLGNICFLEGVTTKLLLIKQKEKSDYRHKIVLGLNIVDMRLTSIIKLSETIGYLGFGDLVYTQYCKNYFKIIHGLPSDITGKIDPKSVKVHKVKMRKNGMLF